jgi:hypothetical protein
MLEPLLAILVIILPLGVAYVLLTLRPHEQKGENSDDNLK